MQQNTVSAKRLVDVKTPRWLDVSLQQIQTVPNSPELSGVRGFRPGIAFSVDEKGNASIRAERTIRVRSTSISTASPKELHIWRRERNGFTQGNRSRTRHRE